MRLRHGAFAVLLIAPMGALTASPVGNPQADPTGEWLVAKRVARIKIVNCNDRLWGVVSWESEHGVDGNNPDPALRTRPTLGMPILLGMTRTKPNEWSGEIYNAEDGRKYASKISLLNPNLLQVQGCVLGILCGGENWTRVGAPATASPASKAATKTESPPPSSDDALCLRIAGAAGRNRR